jgi:hypothetical protein
MWRCEEEVGLQVTPKNVVCLLVNYFKKLMSHEIVEEEIQIQSPISSPNSQEE